MQLMFTRMYCKHTHTPLYRFAGCMDKIKIRYIFIKVSPCFFTYNNIYTKRTGHSHRVMREYAIKLHNNSVGTKIDWICSTTVCNVPEVDS